MLWLLRDGGAVLAVELSFFGPELFVYVGYSHDLECVPSLLRGQWEYSGGLQLRRRLVQILAVAESPAPLPGQL